MQATKLSMAPGLAGLNINTVKLMMDTVARCDKQRTIENLITLKLDIFSHDKRIIILWEAGMNGDNSLGGSYITKQIKYVMV